MAEVPCKVGKKWHNKSRRRAKRKIEVGRREEIFGRTVAKGALRVGESFLKNYAKIILYAYPLLETVGEDYEEHIKTKAALSYGKGAFETAAYLVSEILEMRSLEWLKSKVEEVLEKLSETERALLAVRYFGKSKRALSALTEGETERTYFRKQRRLLEKVAALFPLVGLTERVYDEEFAKMRLFSKIARCVEEKRDRRLAVNERKWIDGYSTS